MTWKRGAEIVNSKFVPFVCAVDSVARPLLQGSVQFNGYSGCSFCLHPGKLVERTVKYCIDVDYYTDRTDGQIRTDMERPHQINKKWVHGIKKKSSLFDLPLFDLVWGFSSDYMHSCLQGVARQFMELWTRTPQMAYYIGSPKMKLIIEERLKRIMPPMTVHRTPRSLKEKCNWKATEWRMWILHYCIPCLTGVLQLKYLEHFSLFCESVYLLTMCEISMDAISQAGDMLEEFVLQVHVLYGAEAMTFNVHLMTHLAKSVEMSGPLWATSAFPFEAGIHTIQKLIKGPRGVLRQVTKKVLINNSIPSLKEALNIRPNVIRVFESLRGIIRLTDTGILPLGKGKKSNETVTNIIKDKFLVEDGSAFQSFMRIKVKGSTFHSKKYNRPKTTDDTYAHSKNGTFGQIEDICEIRVNENVQYVVVIRVFNVEPLSVGSMQTTHIFKCSESEDLNVFPVTDIASCVFIQISNTLKYFSVFSNDVEVK